MALDTSIALGVRNPQFQTIDPMTIYQAMEGQRLNALRERALEQEMQRNALSMQYATEDRRAAAAQAAQARAQAEELKRLFQSGYQPAKNPVMGPGTIQGATPAGFDYEGVKNKLIGAGNVGAFKTVSELQEQEAKRREAEAKATGQGFTNTKTQAETLGVLTENQKKLADLADVELKRISTDIDRAPSIEAVNMLYDANPNALAVTGKTPEQAKTLFAQRAAEVGFDRARMEVANGVMAVQKQLSDEVKTLETPQGYVEYRPGAGTARPITVGGQPAMPTDKRSVTNINTVDTASETAMKEYVKDISEQRKMYASAPAVLENIEKSKALIPEASKFMGTGGEALLEATKFFNNRVGTAINTKNISSAEELRSRLFMGVMDNLKKMDSQPTQAQQAALQEAVGKLGSDPNALPQILDIMGDALRTKIDLYNADVTEAEKRGVKFPFKPQIELSPKPSAAGAATGAGGGTTFTPPAGWSHVVK